MNTIHDQLDSRTETAATDINGRGNRRAVETPAMARRPHANSEENTPAGPPPNQAAGKNQRPQTLAVGAALLVAVGTGVYYDRCILPYESTDDAFVEGHVIPLASQVPGRVAELMVKDNQEVKQGEMILKIDARDYETSVAEARADLAAARSQRDQAQAQVSVSQAKVAEARATVAADDAENLRAAEDLKRYESVESRAVSQSALDQAQAQARAAAANLEAARSQAQAAEAEVTLSEAGVETAGAAVQQAEARLRQAELNLAYTQVTAPESGRVTHRTVEQGAYIQTGQSLLAIVPKEAWILANFKETQLKHMRAGQPVTVKVDAYPQFIFQGHVDSMQGGSGARFSLFPPENATGNYVKVVQRVPVKIVLDEASPAGVVLGPGMSVVPEVRVK